MEEWQVFHLYRGRGRAGGYKSHDDEAYLEWASRVGDRSGQQQNGISSNAHGTAYCLAVYIVVPAPPISSLLSDNCPPPTLYPSLSLVSDIRAAAQL